LAQRGFREVRPDRAASSVADQEDLGREPRPELLVIPHVTQFDEADVTALGPRVTLNKENEGPGSR
jgi:hypothetical protein